MPMKKNTIVLGCISLAWFLILSGRYSISNLLPEIVKDLGFGWTQAGAALSAMWLFYALMQFPSGVFSDVKGRRISILLSMAVFSFAYLLVGFSIHYVMFLFAVVLLGAGTGMYPPAGVSMITDIFKKNRGKALGVRSSAGSLAYGVPLLAAWFGGVYGWRSFFFLWSGVCFLGILVFYVGTHESTVLPSVVSLRERVVDGFKVFSKKGVLLIFVVNLFAAITWISYMSFFPSFLIVARGFSEVQAALALVVLGVGGFVFKPVVGSLADRFNRKSILLGLCLIASIGALVLVWVEPVWLILLVSFVPSLATAMFPVIESFLMDSFEEKGRAGKLGFYRTVLILLASPSATVIGVLADTYSFEVPFIGLSLLLFAAAMVLVFERIYTRVRAT